MGQAVCQLQNLYLSGKINEAVQLQHRLISPNSAVSILRDINYNLIKFFICIFKL